MMDVALLILFILLAAFFFNMWRTSLARAKRIEAENERMFQGLSERGKRAVTEARGK